MQYSLRIRVKPSRFVILLLLALMETFALSAQELLKFSIADFDVDPFDLSAKDRQYEKFDGNGDRYAIIKVRSNNPGDKLSEYSFNFGNMKHVVEERDGVLWLYVQRNAKLVTITRNGYVPINKFDLHTTIESGKNYIMSITSEEKKVHTQMVQFKVKPVDSRAVVMVKASMEDSQEMLFGYVDVNGSVARSLEYGTYIYKVLADNFHMAEGRFTLNNRLETLIENIDLKPNFSDMTFNVDADADIYINGEKKGTRQWSGRLKAGKYQVECRQINHKPSSHYIEVTENDNRTINLNTPEPILGMVSITSTPLDAEIKIDGTSYGQTPKNFDILIGEHTIELLKEGHKPEKRVFNIQENRTTEINITFGNTSATIISSNPSNASVYIDGAYKGNTPYTYEGEVGEHKIKLLYDGFKSIEKNVYLGSSDKLSFPLIKMLPFIKPTDFYIGIGVGVGQVPFYSENTPVNFAFGAGSHFNNFNVELSFSYLSAFKKEINFNDERWFSDAIPYSTIFNMGIKLGYGFIVGNRFKITPQIGYKFTRGKEWWVDYRNASNFTIGVRAFCALSKRFGVSVTPEYSIGDYMGRGINGIFALSLTF